MSNKGCNHAHIWQRAGKAALAVVLALSLCPGSRELFENIAFASPIENTGAFESSSQAPNEFDGQFDEASETQPEQGDSDTTMPEGADSVQGTLEDQNDEEAVADAADDASSADGSEVDAGSEEAGSAGRADDAEVGSSVGDATESSDPENDSSSDSEVGAEASNSNEGDVEGNESQQDGSEDSDDSGEKASDEDGQDNVVVLEADADGAHAQLSVDPSVELPENAQLVVTALVNQDANEEDGEGDGEEPRAEDEDSAVDESDEGDGAPDESDSGEADESVSNSDEQNGEDDASVSDSDDKAKSGDELDAGQIDISTASDELASDDAAGDSDIDDGSDEEGTADGGEVGEVDGDEADGDEADGDDADALDQVDADEAEAVDENASSVLTGADVTLAGLAKAVEVFLQAEMPDNPVAVNVAQAYVAEVVDADGNLVQIPQDKAELKITITDSDRVALFSNAYAVERAVAPQNGGGDASAMSTPVSSVLNEEYASADDAATAIQFEGMATPAAENIAADEATGGISASLQGVQSLVALDDVSMSSDGDAATATAKIKGATTGATIMKKLAGERVSSKAALAAGGAGGPLRSDPKPGVKSTVDTTIYGMTMNLFDYEAVDNNSNHYGNAYTDNSSYSGINTGRNRNNQLMFYGYGDGVSANSANYTSGTNPGNGINQFTGVGTYNNKTVYTLQFANQGIVQSKLSSDGYPLLNTNASDKTTNYIFDPSEAYDGSNKRTTYENVSGLFYLNNKGTPDELLTYDSNKAYAYYDRSQGDNGSFKVYNGTYDRNGGSTDGLKVGFFPFNDWWTGPGYPEINPTSNAWNYDVNHHLGMTLNVPMMMPYDGKIRYYDDDGTYTDSDMVFNFSGDDDMWVFVDGKLVLDIGGIHQPVSGTINFSTGEVVISYGTVNAPNNGVQGTHYTYPAAGINAATEEDGLVRGDKVYLWNVYDNGGMLLHQGILGEKDSAKNRAGTPHTLQAFYLERGGCDSNLMISTNLHLAAPQTASIEKEWEGLTDEEAADKQVQVELIRKATDYDTGEPVGYSVVGTKILQGETLDADTWAHKWEKLPSNGYNATGVYADYDENGNPGNNRYCNYTYFVREVPVPGYIPTYAAIDADGADAGEYGTNDLEKIGDFDKKAVTIQSPTLAGVTDSGNPPITGVKIQRTSKERTEGATESEPQDLFGGEGETLNNDNLWQVSYDGLPAWEKNDDTYIDYAYKSNLANTEAIEALYRLGQDLNAAPNAAAVPANGAVKVTNEPIYLDVQKKWLNSKGQDETADSKHNNDSVWIQLQKQEREDAEADWGNWTNEGEPVELKRNMGGDNDPWTTKFKVSADENVRYRMLEGTYSNDEFTPSSQLTTASGKTYVHAATDYTRDGAWWLKANDSEPYTATQEGTTWEKRYYWEELPLTNEADSPKNYLRTFDGESEVKQHTGSAEDTFEKDVIKVELTIPAMADSIPDDADSKYDYNATVSLGALLAASMTEPEPESGEDPTWDVVASGDVNVELTPNADAGTIIVNVPFATAKANAGKTITLTVPVEGRTTSNLSTITERSSAVVRVVETRYASAANSGAAEEYEKESTGGEYVSLGDNGTGAHAVISNKPLVTKLTVKKKWEDYDPEDSGSNDHANDTVWVRILKDGAPATTVSPNPVELKKDMGQDKPEWAYTFEDLDLGGTYTIEEGTNEVPEGETDPVFVPTTRLEYGSGANKKTYVQKSLKYYNADETERLKTEVVEEVEKQVPIGSIDGAVAPDAGTAILENGIPGVEIQLLKVDADSEVDEDTGLKTPLEGAKFKVYKDVMPEGAQSVTFNKDDDIQDANLVKKTIETDDGTEEISEYETDAAGAIDFPILEPGFYWLVETGAPAGYLVRDATHPVGIEVDANSNPSVKGIDVETGEAVDATEPNYDTDKSRPVLKVVDADGKIVMWDHDEDPATADVEKTEPTEDGETYALVFPNLRTYLLPSTGGPGVLPFLFVGAFLATLAVGGGLSPRRRANAPLGVVCTPTAKVQAASARRLRRSTAHSQRTRGGGRWQ